MLTTMTRFHSLVAAAVAGLTLSSSSSSTVLAVKNGDKCGVTSRDFLNYDYRSDYLVAGEAGCTFDNNSNNNSNSNNNDNSEENNDNDNDSNCFCAPNLSDGQSLSEWEWQCNGAVVFGPAAGTNKVCPSTVPVAKGLGVLEIVRSRSRSRRSLQEQEDEDEDAVDTTTTTNNNNSNNADKIASVGTESMQSQLQGIPCDTSIHPTGRPGDEVCPYSDCDEGGDHSAICACVDLAKYGMGSGTEWVCMHSTCSCGVEEEQEEEVVVVSENENENENGDEEVLGEALEASTATSVAVSALASISMLATAMFLN